jgi:ubiquinone/menaquinone biosynthesis C-methylase UbiE
MMARVEKASLSLRRREVLAGLEGEILEIGCGTGANIRFYTNSPSLIVSDPDTSGYPNLIGKAVEGGPAFNLVVSTAEAIPFSAGQFDHVVSTLVLCSVPDPCRVITEIHRVLKPNGSLRFIEHIRADGSKARLQDLVQPIWSVVSSGCHPNRPTVANLAAAGFKIDELSLFDPFSSFHGILRFFLRFLTPFAQGKAVKS